MVFFADFAAARAEYNEKQPAATTNRLSATQIMRNDLAALQASCCERYLRDAVLSDVQTAANQHSPSLSITLESLQAAQAAMSAQVGGWRGYMVPAFRWEWHEPAPIPSDPEERNNALSLLESVVGKKATEEFKETGALRIKRPYWTYLFKEGQFTERFNKYAWQQLCYELPPGYHAIDKMIAEVLMIQTDEKKYLETANLQASTCGVQHEMEDCGQT